MPERRPPVPRFDLTDALLDGRAEDVLDLHGYYGSEATTRVRNFIISSSRRYPGKIVHVITGKGRGSPNGPVLKPLVKRLLQTELSKFVADCALDLDETGYRIRLK